MIDPQHGHEVEEVRQATERIVSAYGNHRTDEYFSCFHPEATFVFYNVPGRLESRDAFRKEWERWEREDGLHVLQCTSTERLVQPLGNVAVVSHRLLTRLRTHQGEETLRERETIVFARQEDGSWLVVHEHLSPDPAT